MSKPAPQHVRLLDFLAAPFLAPGRLAATRRRRDVTALIPFEDTTSRIRVLVGMVLGLALTVAATPARAGSVSTDGQLVSTVPTGTAPLAVSSTTVVENLNAELLGGLPASAFARPVGHLVTVGKSGGDFTSIQAAIDSITGASFNNWYTVLVGPGTYAEEITLKDFVTVRGYGFPDTAIQVVSASDVTGVHGAGNAVLRDIWIYAESTQGDAVAIDGPLMLGERVVVHAKGGPTGEATGLLLGTNEQVSFVDSEIVAHSAFVNIGIDMNAPASVTMEGGEVKAQATALGTVSYGIRRDQVGIGGVLDLEGTEVIAVADSVAFGIRNETGALRIERSSIFATALDQSVGVSDEYLGQPIIRDTEIHAAGDPSGIGFEKHVGAVTFYGGKLRGGNSGPAVTVVGASASAYLAYTEISGALTGDGVFHCIGTYDDFDMAPEPCP